MKFPGNYPIELERRDLLQQGSRPFLRLVSGYTAPRKLTCRGWFRTENQGGVGRCGGMGSSSGGEWLYRAATGKLIQFNGHFSYIRAQGFSRGLLGRDAGSTIHGNKEAAEKFGFCPEDWDGDGQVDYPLPPRYTIQIPEGADAQAAPYKIQGHTWIETLDEWEAFLKSGQGPILVGAKWGNWGPDRNGVCSSFNGGGRSGHAWLACGWDDDLAGGCTEMVNSHGLRWGLDGFGYLTRPFVQAMLRDGYTAAVGISDLTVPKKRAVDWSEEPYL
jgi:hypothetical protein